MDYLPLFADLKNRPVLVVGGGEVAARKIELLRRSGAQISVIARQLNQPLQQLADQQQIKWLAREFEDHHPEHFFLVIAATSDHPLNARVSAAAGRYYRLVNVVDSQPECSFIFPAIVDRSPLMVAVSSGGTAPVLARLVREKLEALLPASLGRVATIAGQWRDRVKQHLPEISLRRQFWERLFSGRFASQIAAGNISQAETELKAQLEQPEPQGEIILVGAGPGDSGLLTLRGLQVMQQADVVLYDHLVSEEILDLVRRDAERICVGKRAGTHMLQQQQTNQLLVALARQGKRVVRLKGGDPFIFGRGGEELQVAREAGIPVQVVPGITAASGATAYAGIPLTHRDYAQSVLLITGHCRSEQDIDDWPLLARSRQTLVIYMGKLKAAVISQQLIEHGRDASTPIAVISCGTRQNQQVLTGTLRHLAELAEQSPGPALLVVGEVVRLREQLAWFEGMASVPGRDPAVINLE